MSHHHNHRDDDDMLASVLDAARSRTSPWDSSRQARVLGKAENRLAVRAGRRTMVRRGVAIAAGAMMIAFGFRAVASSPHASSASMNEPAAQVQASPLQDNTHDELASRALADAGYGRD